jgi:O-antigen/teichoic acid export membrane protein
LSIPEEPTDPEPTSETRDSQPISLKDRVVRGSAVTFIGFGLSNAVRLVGGILLTWIAFKENAGALGVMALVDTLMTGLQMFSDLGAGPAIVRDKRGDDPDFLNTAWTIQAVRGVGLWLCACILAWPMAFLYDEPMLWRLIPAAGFAAVLNGFNATAMHTARRHLALGRLTVLGLSGQVVKTGMMLLWGWLSPSVWALVAGGLAGGLARLVLSHTILPGIRNRFHWDREASHSLFHFGKWIFMSSALTFFARMGDRLILGYVGDSPLLGVYTRAPAFSDPIATLNERLSRRVVFPALSHIGREELHRLRQAFYKARLALDVVFMPSAGLLMAMGAWLVGWILPPEYQEAGWMLQILCVRLAMRCALVPCQSCMVALGLPKYAFLVTLVRTVWIVPGMLVGWHFWGIAGLVWAAALSEVPVLFVLWFGLWRQRVLNLRREALALGLVGLGLAVGQLALLVQPILVEWLKGGG